MDYISTEEAAKKWGINARRVRYYLNTDRIPGAKLIGKKWCIPVDANKPIALTSQIAFCQKPIGSPENNVKDGIFGKYGGCFMPKAFKDMLKPITEEFETCFNSVSFISQLKTYYKNFVLRPTPLYYASRYSASLDKIHLYIKREDLNSAQSLYINQTLPLAMMAKNMGKKVIVGEMGDANYAFALANAAKMIGISAKIYISERDLEKQTDVIERLKMMGASVYIITDYEGGFYRASNNCFSDYLIEGEDTFYCFHDAVGPHPFPTIAEKTQEIVGIEAKEQFQEQLGKNPDYIVAPLMVASNALGIMSQYLGENTTLILVGPVFYNKNGEPKTFYKNSFDGYIQGCFTKVVYEPNLWPFDLTNECPGFEYPALNPKIANMIDQKRVSVVTIDEQVAIKEMFEFGSIEGFIPSLEDAYTLAYVRKMSNLGMKGTVLMALTGTGIKDAKVCMKKYKDYFSE